MLVSVVFGRWLACLSNNPIQSHPIPSSPIKRIYKHFLPLALFYYIHAHLINITNHFYCRRKCASLLFHLDFFLMYAIVYGWNGMFDEALVYLCCDDKFRSVRACIHHTHVQSTHACILVISLHFPHLYHRASFLFTDI